MDVEVVRKSRGIDPKERKPRSTAQLPVYREARDWHTSSFVFLAHTRSYRIRQHIKAMLTDDWYRYFILANNIKVKAKQKVWKQ